MSLKNQWKKEEERTFKGWDFSYLNNRWREEGTPWNYRDIINIHLKNNYKLLDMGTGGGEFLLTLNHPHKLTSVTEGWQPNVKLCKETLSPLGIEVKQVFKDSELPFLDDSFDLIINRHESYDEKEIKRILKPNGVFITQQVGGRNNEKLSNLILDNFKTQYSNLNLSNSIKHLTDSSFEILYKNEYFPYLRFFDVGAIVYYAKIINWEFPNFSVDSCYDKLFELHKELETKPYIESYEHRFIIVAKNTK